MAYCCVPNCKSKFLKGSGVSFHEIPADAELRSKWLKVISRKNWQPNSISNYSRVCNKHFVDSDFKQFTKFKRLEKYAVPSIFPDYPSYLQPPAKKARISLATEKRNKFVASVLSDQTHSATDQLNVPSSSEVVLDNHNVEDKVTQANFILKERNQELNYSKLKLKRCLQKMQNLQDKYDKSRDDLNQYKNNLHIVAYVKVLEAAKDDKCASFIIDLVDNFGRKHPQYNESTIRQSLMWRACSTKGYEYARQNLSLTLPSRTTLARYMGNLSEINDVGVNALIAGRIKAEVQQFQAPQEKMCSLIIDEMSMQQRLVYDKKNDKFIGAVDMGEVKVKTSNEQDTTQKMPLLANHLLCFVACGLSTSYKIPVAYFFTRQLKGQELYEIVKYVCKEVEMCGLSVTRLVTDNLSVNCTMFRYLSKGAIKERVSHPADPKRDIFLSFDYCHLIKNARSQFLRHPFGGYLKELYEIQYRESRNIKPVRFLTKKHVYPSNFEKMNVKRAIQVFSPPVTAALEAYKTEACKIAPKLFADSGPAIQFMKIMYKWFTLHDVSNCTQHIRYANPDSRQYDSTNDERLDWLSNTFLNYIATLQTKETCMFTKETYEALILTTKSTVECISHLLTTCKFGFVLSRKFSSDPVEALFGSLRQASGCHYQQDAASVSAALKKILVTGIVSSTTDGNVVESSQSFSNVVAYCKPANTTSTSAIVQNVVASTSNAVAHNVLPLTSTVAVVQNVVPSTSTAAIVQNVVPSTSTAAIAQNFIPSKSLDMFPSSAIAVLNVLFHTQKNHVIPTTMLNISLALIAGYIVRVVDEKVNCKFCLELIETPRKCTPLLKLIFYQDRVGLRYPAHSLVSILCTLQRFAELSLPELKSSKNVLENMTKTVLPYLLKCPALHCCNPNKEELHLEKLCTLIINKFLKPILSNYANNVTDHQQKTKKLKKKPLSRKILTVNT